MPLNQRVDDKMFVFLSLKLDRLSSLSFWEWLFLFSRETSKSSRLSSMLLIDFSCQSSKFSFFFFLRSDLYYFTKRRFLFCIISPRSLSSRGESTVSSNSSDLRWRMLRCTAIRLIFARKLGWYTFGCLFGYLSSAQMWVGLIYFLLSRSRSLIFSISMSRSICFIVSSLRRSQEGGLITLRYSSSFLRYLGRYSSLMRRRMVESLEFRVRLMMILLRRFSNNLPMSTGWLADIPQQTYYNSTNLS